MRTLLQRLRRGTGTRTAEIAWPPVAMLGVSAAVAYAFDYRPYPVLLTANMLAIGGWLVTDGESMPGEYDNPEGDALHPYALGAILFACLAITFTVGCNVPAFREFRFGG